MFYWFLLYSYYFNPMRHVHLWPCFLPFCITDKSYFSVSCSCYKGHQPCFFFTSTKKYYMKFHIWLMQNIYCLDILLLLKYTMYKFWEKKKISLKFVLYNKLVCVQYRIILYLSCIVFFCSSSNMAFQYNLYFYNILPNCT